MGIFEITLAFVGSSILFVVSVALHELSHVVAMKLLGIRPNRLVVVFFQFPRKSGDPWGYAGSEDGIFHCSHSWKKTAFFLVSISGGIGSAILICPLCFFPLFQVPVLIMIFVQLFFALFEGYVSLKPS